MNVKSSHIGSSNFGLRFRLRRLTAMRGIMFQFCLIVHALEVEIDALPDGRLLEGSWEGEQPGECWPDRYVIQVNGTCDGAGAPIALLGPHCEGEEECRERCGDATEEWCSAIVKVASDDGWGSAEEKCKETYSKNCLRLACAPPTRCAWKSVADCKKECESWEHTQDFYGTPPRTWRTCHAFQYNSSTGDCELFGTHATGPRGPAAGVTCHNLTDCKLACYIGCAPMVIMVILGVCPLCCFFVSFFQQTSTPVVAVTDSVDDSANADAEAPELSPPPAIGPNGVPIEAKPRNAVESEKQ